MKKLLFAFTAAATLLLCGCKTQLVALTVNPPDARIIANGVEYTGRSPMFIDAPTGKQLAITAYKEGYRDKIYVVDYELSKLGQFEAATSIFILPAFGLLFDTAWQLKQNNITLELEPLGK